MKLIAAKPMSYGGKRLDPGTEFEASRQDARVLTALGRAKISNAIQPRDMAADDASKKDAPKKRSKRNYQRRDMRAED